MAGTVVNPFRQLLNTISSELSKENLRSLVHICGPSVPESRRENIHCGLDLFECLIHCNVIGDNVKLAANLLDLMRQMRPKRKDLITTVKQFIRDNYDPYFELDSHGESLHRDRESYHGYTTSCSTLNHTSSYATDSSVHLSGNETDYSWNCVCFVCRCIPRRVPTCVFAIGSFICLLLIIIVSLIWFVKVSSKVHTSLGDMGRYEVGASIVSVLAALFLFFSGFFLKRMWDEVHMRRLPLSPVGYGSINSSLHQPPYSHSSCAVSTEVRRPKRYRKSRRQSTSTAATGSITDASPVGQHGIPDMTARQMSYPDHHENAMMTEDGGETDESADGVSRRSSLIPSDDDISSPMLTQPQESQA